MNRFLTLVDDLTRYTEQPGLAMATQSSQQKILDSARKAAQMRVQRAYLRLNGTHPTHGQRWRREGLHKAKVLIDRSISNIDDVVNVLSTMHTVLSSSRRFTTQHNAAHCHVRGAYYDASDRRVHLCPAFFTSTSEEQIRTMIHEAAHAAGIGQSQGESYLVIYDCTTSFNDKNVADGWAHFVHCFLDLPPDPPNTIRGTVPVQPTAPKSSSPNPSASSQSLGQAMQANCPQMPEAPVGSDEFVIDVLQYFFGDPLTPAALNDQLRHMTARMLWAASQSINHRDLISHPPQGVPSVAWLVSEAVQLAFRRANNRCLYQTVKATVANNFRSAYEITKVARRDSSHVRSASAEVAVAVAGLGWTVFQGIAQNKGDITWKKQRMEGVKYPWEKKKEYENIATFASKDLTVKQEIVTAAGLDEVSATFKLNFRYDGHSVGYVSVDNIGTNDAPFWDIDIEVTIMPDPNAYTGKQGKPVAAVEVTFNFRFTHSIRDDSIYLEKIVLYGDGDIAREGRWTQW